MPSPVGEGGPLAVDEDNSDQRSHNNALPRHPEPYSNAPLTKVPAVRRTPIAIKYKLSPIGESVSAADERGQLRDQRSHNNALPRHPEPYSNAPLTKDPAEGAFWQKQVTSKKSFYAAHTRLDVSTALTLRST